MTRDEFLDAVVEKCVPMPDGRWGMCRTHRVGWAPVDFKDGRCWKAFEVIAYIDIAEPLIRQQVAKEIDDVAFRVFDDTDGHKSIMVHDHHEGLALAADIAREKTVDSH